jgi:SAM-dependent methyltransferase
MPDPIFAERRLAEIYDPLDPDRSDLEVYAAVVQEFGARSVLDVGCGTGTFACLLAGNGLDVVAVDPAAASLEVARRKPDADRVRWLLGDATTLPPLRVDVATMTGNVAQVFLTDDEWLATLHGVRNALRPGGRVVFEVRDPSRQAWRAWNRDESYERVDLPGVGTVNHWAEVTAMTGQLVTFKWTFHFERSGEVITSDSTLRFRERDEVESSLRTLGVARRS